MTDEARLTAAFMALNGLKRFYDPIYPDGRTPYTALATLMAQLQGYELSMATELKHLRAHIAELSAHPAAAIDRGAIYAGLHALLAVETACDPVDGDDVRATVRTHLELSERAMRR